jgi:Arc/MetJ-type ribon-helix-helix transcriptional regulator
MSLENEQVLEALVASGRFPSRQDALDEAVRLLRQEVQANGHAASDALTAVEWCERFEKRASGHRALKRPADDSRETIYSDRDG